MVGDSTVIKISSPRAHGGRRHHFRPRQRDADQQLHHPRRRLRGHGSPLFAAVCATAFAYEGWIIATSINAELKDSKRNLPKALLIGGLIIVATYILYYIGVAGGATNQELCDSGATAAFINVFGPVLGNILNLFIAISCMGTMNGLMLGCCRGPYSLAARGRGAPTPSFSVR